MKKNAMLVSSVAGLVLLTSAVTFASTSPSFTEQSDMPMMQDLLGGPQNMFDGFDGSGKQEGKMKGRGMKGGPNMWIGLGNPTNMQAIQTAIENNDYTAYTTAYTNAMMTQDQFNTTVSLHQKGVAVETAIKNGDYTAYVAAAKGTPMEGKMTQTQFHAMVLNNTARAAMETAITNNDYTAYVAAVKGTKMEGKTTQAQFTDMVAKHTQRTAERAAVLNNDYTAFLAAIKGTPMEGKVTQEQFATMVTNMTAEKGQSVSTTK